MLVRILGATRTVGCADDAHVWLRWRDKNINLTNNQKRNRLRFLVSTVPAESPFTIHTGTQEKPTSQPLLPLFPRDPGSVKYASNCRCENSKGHEIHLKMEILKKAPGTRLAFNFRTVNEKPQHEIVVPLKQGNSVSSRGSSKETPTPNKYIVLPGNYSGDSWACVAAMVLDPTIHVVLAAKDKVDKKMTRYDEIAKQFSDFAQQAIEDAKDRLLVSEGGMGQHGNAREVAKQAGLAIEKHKSKGADPLVGWTFSSTSVVMRAAEMKGLDELRKKLVDAFTAKSKSHDTLVKRIKDYGPCVLLNMRVGVSGNHPQHNMTQTIYKQLKKQIKNAGFKIVRIGTYQGAKETPGAKWMEDLQEEGEDGILIDFFEPGGRADRRHTAYFWSEVAKLSNVFGVMGGRSGSLDIAAFMGVRAFCWDINKRDDAGFHEYVRQLLMFPIMSIGRRCTPEKEPKSGHYFVPQNPSPAHGLEEVDVDCWLTGHHILPAEPLRSEDLTECLRLSEGGLDEVGRKSLLLAPLVYAEDLVDGNGDSSDSQRKVGDKRKVDDIDSGDEGQPAKKKKKK